MKPSGRGGRTKDRLPNGLYLGKRANGATYYYSRIRCDGEDRRVVHKTDNLDMACSLHHGLRARGVAVQSWTQVRDAWQRWVELDIGAVWKEKNWRIVKSRFAQHVDPLLGGKRVSDLAGDDTRRLRKRLMASGYSPQTVGHVLTSWTRFCEWMLGEGYLHKSPVPRGVRPKVAESLPNPLTEEEVMKVLAVGGEHAFAARIILASGFRWSDVVRLQATDLKSDGKLTIACSKTGKVLRAPLGQSDQDLYQEIRQRVGPLVPFSVNAVGSFNKTVRRRSGVKRFGSYRLRDTFACRWLDRGGSLTDLQAILGHADPATTMRYGRPSDERIASEATRMALHAGQ